MDFTEALEQMKAGKRLAFPSMEKGSYYEYHCLGKDDNVDYFRHIGPIMTMSYIRANLRMQLATDWYIVTEN